MFEAVSRGGGDAIAEKPPSGAGGVVLTALPSPAIDLMHEITQLRTQLALSQQSVAASTAQVTQLTSHITLLTQQNMLLHTQVGSFGQENIRLTQDNSKLAQEKAAMQAQLLQVTATATQLQAQHAAVTQQVAALQTQMEERDAELTLLRSPVIQVADAIASIRVPETTWPDRARDRLEQAVRKLSHAQAVLAVSDLDKGIAEIREAIDDLVGAKERGADTTPFQISLVEGVGHRVEAIVNGMTLLLGESNAKVGKARVGLAEGAAFLQRGDLKKALESFQKALRQAADAR